ncbi:MAG: phytanoyl-CoA dioxygenase family protein [Acidimicrobiia bacterium]
METIDIDARLRESEALAEQHRALEAVEALHALYQSHPDARVAQRLVELRHAAFPELPKDPGRPEWPATFADPFPGEEGIPAVGPAELTGSTLGGAITHHGCLRVDGLVDSATAERLCDRIEQAFTARERLADGEPVDSAAPWFVPYAPGRAKAEGFGRDLFVRVIDAPEAMCDLVDVFASTGVRQVVTEYLGERPAMIANKWVMRRSPSGVLLGDFHQDGAFLGEGIRTVDCWIALSHCGPGTGRPAMDVVPRRLDGIIPPGEGAAFDWSLSEQTVRDALPGAPVLSPVFRPGDALFFDERLPHRTSVGTELGTRYAIESWFVAPSSYPDKHLPVVL